MCTDDEEIATCELAAILTALALLDYHYRTEAARRPMQVYDCTTEETV